MERGFCRGGFSMTIAIGVLVYLAIILLACKSMKHGMGS
jgi:hypothetical protein